MSKHRLDALPRPQDFIAALGNDNKEGMRLLERCHIAIAIFECQTFGTSALWDVGYCLGYAIYAYDKDFAALKYCESALSQLGYNLAEQYYHAEDRRPYGRVLVRPSTDLAMLTPGEQANFLNHCWHKQPPTQHFPIR